MEEKTYELPDGFATQEVSASDAQLSYSPSFVVKEATGLHSESSDKEKCMEETTKRRLA